MNAKTQQELVRFKREMRQGWRDLKQELAPLFSLEAGSLAVVLPVYCFLLIRHAFVLTIALAAAVGLAKGLAGAL